MYKEKPFMATVYIYNEILHKLLNYKTLKKGKHNKPIIMKNLLIFKSMIYYNDDKYKSKQKRRIRKIVIINYN